MSDSDPIAFFRPRIAAAASRRPAPAVLAALRCAARLAAPAWLSLIAGNALAQTPPDAGRLLEETRAQPRPALPPSASPRVVEPPARPTLTLPEGATVQVSGFRISGASSYAAEELARLVQPWVGRRLDINGLNDAAGALTRHYQGAGHLLTYAYLPAQRVADGVIELAVLEGRLEAVQVVTAQDVRLRDEVIQAHADPLAGQQPVLQADVERRLLLLNDIPGVTARAAFTPGGSTGGADMLVSVAEDEPLAVRAEINNHGSRSTGEYRTGFDVQLRDAFGWGDATRANALTSNRGGLVSGGLSTSVPVGGNGYRLGASLSRLTYQLAGSFRDLGAVGTASTLGVDASYPFLRTSDANLSVKLSYEQKRLRDEVQLIGRSNPKRNDVGEVAVSFDRRDGWGGATAGSLTASLGSLKILSDELRAEDVLKTARSYGKASAQLVRQQSLSGPFSLYLRASGQASGGNLDSSEKLGLSGPGMVRAYAPGVASVDQGALISAELRYAQPYAGGGFLWGLFYDQAEGLVNRRPIVSAGNSVRVAGSGLSVQWSGGDLALSASLAFRSRPALGSDADTQPRLYLQLMITP